MRINSLHQNYIKSIKAPLFHFILKVSILLLGLHFYTLNHIHGQTYNLGMPIIKNYSKEVYQAGTQTWEISQDSLEHLYLANNDGLLIFNGSDWTTHTLPNKTIVRSLELTESKIYVGGQNELGYFQKNDKGILIYHSLKNLIPEEYREFADVWNVVEFNQSIFFRTSFQVFQFKNNTIRVHNLNASIRFIGSINGELFCQDNIRGIYLFKNGAFNALPSGDFFRDKIITDAVKFNDRSLFTTLKNGIFQYENGIFSPWKSPHQNLFKQNRIFDAVTLANNKIALATSLDGVYILDNSARITEKYSLKEGLQNNNTISLFQDHYKNLWVGLDNGIDNILLNAPYRLIFPDQELKGSGYTSIVHKDKIYFGTSNGLYVNDWKDQYYIGEQHQFKLIPGTQGQVWNLDKINEQLILGHHEGSFLVESNRVKKISSMEGAWLHLPFKEDRSISGHYTGLSISKEGTPLSFAKTLEGFEESSRFVVLHQDEIWVSHPYKGVYRIQTDPEKERILNVQLYGQKDGLPNDLFNHVFKVANDLIVAGEQGIFSFDSAQDKFILSDTYVKHFGTTAQIKRLIEDDNNNIWFVKGDHVGQIKMKKNGLEQSIESHTYPFLKKKLIGGFEHIYPHDEKNIFFGAEKGFIHFNPQKTQDSYKGFRISLNQIQLLAEQDSILAKTPSTNNKSIHRLKSKENALRFSYSGTFYPDLEHIQYQYRLVGLDREWSHWTSKNEKEYNNLKHGRYTFEVRAKNVEGFQTTAQSFQFRIAPPWYLSIGAYAFYSLLFLLFLVGIIFIPQVRFSKEKAKLQEAQAQKEQAFQEEIKETERALMQVRNEKLQAELSLKNRTLTSSAMHLVQKSELLNKLRKELEGISKDIVNTDTKKRIKKVVRQLNSDEQLDDEWEQFVLHFEQVHSGFSNRINIAFPKLSPKEQKLCIYLRMNFSTKEIAQMMNISVRGVEISRYRLRKKLGIGTETNLSKFMMNY